MITICAFRISPLADWISQPVYFNCILQRVCKQQCCQLELCPPLSWHAYQTLSVYLGTACTAGKQLTAQECGLLEGEEGSTHLNGTAEGDFAITLAEVHVTHTQVGALNKDWEIHLSWSISCGFASTREHTL